MNAEAGILGGFKGSIFQKREESRDCFARDRSRRISPDVVEVKDHDRVAEGSRHGSDSDSLFGKNRFRGRNNLRFIRKYVFFH